MSETIITTASNGWSLASTVGTIQAHRTGWRGVLDAIRAAFTGKPRLTVPQSVTFSIYVKAQGREDLALIIDQARAAAEAKP